MRNTFIPSTDGRLKTWALQVAEKLLAQYAMYGLTEARAAHFALLANNYAAAFQTAINPDTSTRSAVLAKNHARQLLKQDANRVASIVHGQSNLSEDQIVGLGLRVRNVRGKAIPAPTEPPGVDVMGVRARTVSIRLHDRNKPSRRGRPSGVKSAVVYSYIGEEPPLERERWKYEFSTSRTRFDVSFPLDTPPGTKVWIMAAWQNPRAQSGPTSQPAIAYLQYGLGMAA